MSDIRYFAGYAPTHCTVCGSKWGVPCAPPCINAPLSQDVARSDEQTAAKQSGLNQKTPTADTP